MSYQPQQQPGQQPTPGYAQPGAPAYGQPAPAPGYGYAPAQQAPAAAGYGYQPSATPAPAASPGKSMTMLGAIVAVVGVVAGLALILLSGSSKEETVKKFARAPAGCTTSLEFDHAGSYTLYLETKGKVPNLGGDCAANGTTYQHAGAAPSVSVTLVDGAGTAVATSSAAGPSYDAGGYAGSALLTASVPAAGTYQITVTSEASDVAIAIGGDPEGSAGTMKTIGFVVLAAGVLGGLGLIMLGRKRNAPPAAATPAGAWQPQQQAPQQYAQQQPAYPQQPQQAPAQPQWQPQQPAPQPAQPQWPQQPQQQPQQAPQQWPQRPQAQPPQQPPTPGWGGPTG